MSRRNVAEPRLARIAPMSLALRRRREGRTIGHPERTVTAEQQSIVTDAAAPLREAWYYAVPSRRFAPPDGTGKGDAR